MWFSDDDDYYFQRYKTAAKLLRRCLQDLTEVQSMYGQGYDVANFHLNGDLVSLDNFLENLDGDLPKDIKKFLGIPLTDSKNL